MAASGFFDKVSLQELLEAYAAGVVGVFGHFTVVLN